MGRETSHHGARTGEDQCGNPAIRRGGGKVLDAVHTVVPSKKIVDSGQCESEARDDEQ